MPDTAARTQPATTKPPGWPDEVALGVLPAGEELIVHARYLGTRIDTRGLAADIVLRDLAAAAGLTFAFRYGVAVTFCTAADRIPALDMALLAHVQEPAEQQEVETAGVLITDGGKDRVDDDGVIQLADDEEPRLLLVATVLAHSVMLSRDEMLVSEVFDSSVPLVADLQINGKARLSIPAVMRMVGRVLAARHRVMGTAQAGERPDLLWDHPDLDRLYTRLEAEYELGERAEVLERKFGALGDFTEVLLDIAQDKRAVRLEVAIIALIAVELLLSISKAIGG
ncbi:RMD1 family protein [Novosphingobium sp.]|uniref:RMD1 family protein n=1 Tax=Novosphingobium sp. TaxID=1874826 RepID=UPI001E1332B4|nr:RMD1 family protein [Novosphingobium sp.]MBX9663618.1 RMD1 family protein [Novosphingobium sp.]